MAREYLGDFAGASPTRQALDSFLALTEESAATSGEYGRMWTRAELYDVRGSSTRGGASYDGVLIENPFS